MKGKNSGPGSQEPGGRKAAPTPPAEDRRPVAARTPSSVSLHQVEPHPMLDRVALLPDVACDLGRDHHGDPGRQTRATELREDWAAWVEEVRRRGVVEPIRVVRDPSDGMCFLAIDGRHRLAAAREAGLHNILVVVVEEDEVHSLIEGSVNGRRHWTKSQRAWFAVLMHPEVADEEGRKGNQTGSNQHQKRKPAAAAGFLTQSDLAARFGVSERLLRDAIELYRGLEKYPQHRVRFEPSIWGGASLEHVLRGFNAIDAGNSGPGVPVLRYPPDNIRKAWASEKQASHNWATLSEESRSNYERDLRLMTAEMAPDYLAWKSAILAEIAKEKEGEA